MIIEGELHEDGTLSHVRKVEEPPIVQGRMVRGEVRVDEATLDPGRYRVEFDGGIIGEVRVTDPVIARKSNRHERRQDQRVRRYRLPPHPLAGVTRRTR